MEIQKRKEKKRKENKGSRFTSVNAKLTAHRCSPYEKQGTVHDVTAVLSRLAWRQCQGRLRRPNKMNLYNIYANREYVNLSAV